MTVGGLRQAWEALRGIPFIDWRTNLINVLFDYLKSKKMAIPADLHNNYDDFLGEVFLYLHSMIEKLEIANVQN